MAISRIDFGSRISARAVTAGTMVAFGLLILLMTVAAGMGLWTFKLSEVSSLGGGFWTFFFLAWIVCLYVAGYTTTFITRSEGTRDGAVNGLVVWATACVSGCALGYFALGSVFSTMANASPGMYWGAFIGDTLALAAAIWGGSRAIHSHERTHESEEKRNISRRPSTESVLAAR